MRTAIVYESMFGNTEALVDAVASGLRDRGVDVIAIRAGEPTDHDLRDVDLLVLAAPTHALSLSRASSRADAVVQGASSGSAQTGIREWLLAVPDDGERPCVAVFDTRAKVTRRWPGAASRAAGRRLRRMGFDVVARKSFYVEAVTGPLVDGEVDRAHDWAHHLAEILDG